MILANTMRVIVYASLKVALFKLFPSVSVYATKSICFVSWTTVLIQMLWQQPQHSSKKLCVRIGRCTMPQTFRNSTLTCFALCAQIRLGGLRGCWLGICTNVCTCGLTKNIIICNMKIIIMPLVFNLLFTISRININVCARNVFNEIRDGCRQGLIIFCWLKFWS